jgi:hypothetical protein
MRNAECGGRRTEVGGQRSEDRGRKSDPFAKASAFANVLADKTAWQGMERGQTARLSVIGYRGRGSPRGFDRALKLVTRHKSLVTG